jgi:mono/diheme cytochrome c family protein
MRASRALWIAGVAILGLVVLACSAPSASGGAASDSARPGQPGPASPPRSAARPGAGTTASQDSDLVARGKVIFDQTAGGVGCQYCHGLDGKGKAEFAAPDIRGKQEEDVIQAVATRPLMSIVKLSDSEVRAVVAYLATLP